MDGLRFWCLVLVLAMLCPAGSAAGEIAPEVFAQLQQQAMVRVAVSFDVRYAGRDLSPAARLSESGRHLIAETRSQILARLPQGSFRADVLPQSLSVMALEADARALQALAELREVVRVDLDVGGQGHLAQSLPLSGITAAQFAGYSGYGRRVAVLDSGIDSDHPDFTYRIVDQYCHCQDRNDVNCCPNGQLTQSGPGSAEDDNGHGTNVSGIIVAEGDVSQPGGAFAGELVAVKVLGADGSFRSSVNIATAMDWVANNHPELDAVNLSLGTEALYVSPCDDENSATLALSQAVANLRANGTVVTVSSGNAGSATEMSAPACIEDALAVGAVYDGNWGTCNCSCTEPAVENQPTCFSNSNAYTDLFAPGARITSSGLGGTTSTYYGTSQAAPHVAACALLLRERDPALTVSQVEQALLASSTLVTDPKNGLSFPLLDCYDALSRVVDPYCQTGPMTIGPVTFSGTHTVQSEGALATNGSVIVGSGGHVIFRAAGQITLGPGFQVQAGGQFTAQISAVSCM